jgi:hypothetical protein
MLVAGEHADQRRTERRGDPRQIRDVLALHLAERHFGRQLRRKVRVGSDRGATDLVMLEVLADGVEHALVGIERREMRPLAGDHHRLIAELGGLGDERGQIEALLPP